MGFNHYSEEAARVSEDVSEGNVWCDYNAENSVWKLERGAGLKVSSRELRRSY